MTSIDNWLTATALALILGWCAANMDGPTDAQAERDTAAAVASLGTDQQFIHPGADYDYD